MSLELTWQKAPDRIVAGDPFPVALRLRNAMSAPFPVPIPDEAFPFEIRLIGADGAVAAMYSSAARAKVLESRDEDSGRRVALPAGEVLIYAADLSRLSDRGLEPGRYRMQASFYVQGNAFTSPATDLEIVAAEVVALAHASSWDGAVHSMVSLRKDGRLYRGRAPGGHPDLARHHPLSVEVAMAGPSQIALAEALSGNGQIAWALLVANGAVTAVQAPEGEAAEVPAPAAPVETGLEHPRIVAGWQDAALRAVFVLYEPSGAHGIVLVGVEPDGAVRVRPMDGPSTLLTASANGDGIQLFRAQADGGISVQPVSWTGLQPGPLSALTGAGDPVVAIGAPRLAPLMPYVDTIRRSPSRDELTIARRVAGGQGEQAVLPVSPVTAGQWIFPDTARAPLLAAFHEGALSAIDPMGAGQWRAQPVLAPSAQAISLLHSDAGGDWLMWIDPTTGMNFRQLDLTGSL